MTWPAGKTLGATLARAEYVKRKSDREVVSVRDLDAFVTRDDMLLYFLRNDLPVLLEYVAKLEAVAEEARYAEWRVTRGPQLTELDAFKENAEEKHGRPIGIQLGPR